MVYSESVQSDLMLGTDQFSMDTMAAKIYLTLTLREIRSSKVQRLINWWGVAASQKGVRGEHSTCSSCDSHLQHPRTSH